MSASLEYTSGKRQAYRCTNFRCCQEFIELAMDFGGLMDLHFGIVDPFTGP